MKEYSTLIISMNLYESEKDVMKVLTPFELGSCQFFALLWKDVLLSIVLKIVTQSQEMFDTEGENYSAPIIDKLCLFIILMSILNFVKVFITKKHTEAQALFHIFSNF